MELKFQPIWDCWPECVADIRLWINLFFSEYVILGNVSLCDNIMYCIFQNDEENATFPSYCWQSVTAYHKMLEVYSLVSSWLLISWLYKPGITHRLEIYNSKGFPFQHMCLDIDALLGQSRRITVVHTGMEIFRLSSKLPWSQDHLWDQSISIKKYLLVSRRYRVVKGCFSDFSLKFYFHPCSYHPSRYFCIFLYEPNPNP